MSKTKRTIGAALLAVLASTTVVVIEVAVADSAIAGPKGCC